METTSSLGTPLGRPWPPIEHTLGTLGHLWAPFGHAGMPFGHPLESLGHPLGSLWAPLTDIWVHWATPLAPFGHTLKATSTI